MKTFLTIIGMLLFMIMCYYINRIILKKNNKDSYNWDIVNTNIAISILFPLSIGYWLIYLYCLIPNVPDKPYKWL